MAIGVHILAEFYECNPDLLATVDPVREILESTVEEAKLSKLHSHYHQFEPYGVTGFVLLAESHISIHTWPEHGYCAVDVFTCGEEGDAELAYKLLKEKLKPGRVNREKKVRG
ncbi:MAG: S-adenosylmethionine decarboxylase [Candidatus Diapherotrites archaeon]|nr:S-adenosylmethionine decarboxylase [Candidatus Diapherotrites archaeon]